MPPTLTLAGLGWHLMADPTDPTDPTLRPARVVEQAPGLWHVHDGEAPWLARARSRSLSPTPVTGDWVLLAADGSDGALIEGVLPRRTTLSRAEAGGRSAEQGGGQRRRRGHHHPRRRRQPPPARA